MYSRYTLKRKIPVLQLPVPINICKMYNMFPHYVFGLRPLHDRGDGGLNIEGADWV